MPRRRRFAEESGTQRYSEYFRAPSSRFSENPHGRRPENGKNRVVYGRHSL